MNLKRAGIPFLLAIISLPLMATFCPPPTSRSGSGSTPTGPTIPAIVVDPAVAVGRFFSCYLSASGNLTCWKNEYNDDGNSTYPNGTNTTLFEGKVFSSLELGWDGGCALTKDQKVMCFASPEIGGFETKKNDDLAVIKVAGPNARLFAGRSKYGDTICTLSGEGSIRCYRYETSYAPKTIPIGDFIDVAANSCSYGMKANGGLFAWFLAGKDTQAFVQPTTKVVLERYTHTPDLYGSVLSSNKKLGVFQIAPKESSYPEYNATLLVSMFKDIVVSSPQSMCGIKAAGSQPICFKEPSEKFAELDSQELSKKVFDKISLGQDGSAGIGCGIEIGGKLFCWRFAQDAFPEGIPESIKLK